MKTITVHIGNYKTGSTAIQQFIGDNRKRFLETGYYVPLAGFDGSAHHQLVWALRNEAFAESRDEVYRKLNAEIASCGYPDILISSELFFTGLMAQEFRDALQGDVKLRVIAYLRRQDHFLSAFYQQMIKHWRYRQTEKFNIKTMKNGSAIKYAESLDRWAEVAGIDNVIVRPYEMKQLENGLINDFIKVLGRNPKDYQIRSRETRTNATIHSELIEFLRCANTIDMTKDEHEALVGALTELSAINKTGTFSKRSFLSPDERLAVLEEAKAENEEISRKYLGRTDGQLFYEDWPAADEEWSPVELTQEDLVRISVGLWLDNRRKSDGVARLTSADISIKAVQRLLGERARLMIERGDLYRKLQGK